MGFSLNVPQVGQPNSTEQPKEASNFTTLQNWGNGQIDPADVKAAFAQSAGMNQSGQTVKGSSIIATSQTTGSTTFTTLGTPDQVTGIVLSANGLIEILFQATWQESVSGAAQAAIFLGANQLKIGAPGVGAPSVTPCVGSIGGNLPINTNTVLSSVPIGLSSSQGITLGATSAYTGDVSTGQVLGGGMYSLLPPSTAEPGGGPCVIVAAAGTYTVSVQFKATSGTVTVANRRLYVKAESYT